MYVISCQQSTSTFKIKIFHNSNYTEVINQVHLQNIIKRNLFDVLS